MLLTLLFLLFVGAAFVTLWIGVKIEKEIERFKGTQPLTKEPKAKILKFERRVSNV